MFFFILSAFAQEPSQDLEEISRPFFIETNLRYRSIILPDALLDGLFYDSDDEGGVDDDSNSSNDDDDDDLDEFERKNKKLKTLQSTYKNDENDFQSENFDFSDEEMGTSRLRHADLRSDRHPD